MILSGSVIDTDIYPIPMAYQQIVGNVNIELVAIYTQLLPHHSQSINIGLIITVKPVFVLNLNHNDGASIF
jgi:hypothetical protein